MGLVGHFKEVCREVGILEDVMIYSFGSIDLNDIFVDVQMQYFGAEF